VEWTDLPQFPQNLSSGCNSWPQFLQYNVRAALQGTLRFLCKPNAVTRSYLINVPRAV
jgi:hypothetical protein